MDKRVVGFIVVAFGLIMLNFMLGQVLNPNPPLPNDLAEKAEKDKVVEKEAAEQPSKESPLQVDYPGQPPEPPLPSEAEAETAPPGIAAKPPQEEPKEPEKVEAAEPSEPQQHPHRWLTLGSLSLSDNPYRILVTFSTRGAAVHRVELAPEGFRDLEYRGGYLGELGLKSIEDRAGCLVRVVGGGTPAEAAGLQSGDVLTQADDAVIDTPEDLDRVLRTRQPNDQITLTVLREDEPLALSATLGRQPMAVIRPEIENVIARNRLQPEKDPLPEESPPSFRLTMARLGEKSLKDRDAELPDLAMWTDDWEVVEQTDSQVVFRYTLPEGIQVSKRYRLAKAPPEQRGNALYPAYHLELELAFENASAGEQLLAYRLDGPNGLPTEGSWYAGKIGRSLRGSVGLRDFFARWVGQDAVLVSASDLAQANFDEDDPKKVRPQSGTPLIFAGIDAQYFASVLIPMKDEIDQMWIDRTVPIRIGPKPEEKQQLANVSLYLVSKPFTLAAGERFEHRYQVFAGPKHPDVVSHYQQPAAPGYTLSDLVYYGWFWWVAKPMLAVLHFFHSIVGNYGIAIIMLTVLVRGLMFPLSRKQAMNMVKMQQLQPEMKRIQEKYKGKDNMEARTKAQQELFRRENYNPMGGCLLMLVQLPIFLGLYRSLMVDIELRQAPLISESIRWCSNLAAPDMLLDWSGWMPAFVQGFLGPYLNVLPLITVGLFLAQQKMFMPPPADEQAALQQKIMTYMMVFIGFLFYRVASGLCLYFIASTLWGMTERKLLPKPAAPAAKDLTTAEQKAEAAKLRRSESRDGASRNGNGKGKSGSQKQKKKKQKRR